MLLRNSKTAAIALVLAALLVAPTPGRAEVADYEHAERLYQAALKQNGPWEEALKALRGLAAAGNPAAMCRLGEIYAQGRGVPKDPALGAQWYLKSAEAGYPEGQYQYGLCLSEGTGVARDAKAAFRWFSQAAEKGVTEAQYKLSWAYQNGDGVERDIQQANRWFFRAAGGRWFGDARETKAEETQGRPVSSGSPSPDATDPETQYQMGRRYDRGEGVKQDFAEAVRWYRKAAEAGHAGAQYRLGDCYANGEGVKLSLTEAVRWYRKAAEQGDIDAVFALGVCYDNGRGVAKDPIEAVNWYRRAAGAGSAIAAFNLGVCYDKGQGVTRDPVEAVKWHELAAKNGDKPAESYLEILRGQIPHKTYQKGIAAANAWSPAGERPTSPPILKATATFEEPSGNRALDGDEKANLRITVKNTGKGASRQLRGAIQLKSPVAGLSIPPSASFGDIEPGAERTVVIPLTGQRNLATAKATVEISLVDKFNFDAPLVRQTFETRAFVAPKFNVQLGVEDGNGNGLVERGEELTLKVVVKNQGGAARGVKVALSGPEGITWLGQQEQVSLGDIPAGGWKQATFSCLVRNQYAGPESLPLKATITEAREDLGGAFPVALTLNQAGPRVIEQVAQAKAEARSQAPAPELTSELDKPVPSPRAEDPDAVALVIGIERYLQQVPAVPFARRDALAVQKYFQQALGVPPQNLLMLLDEGATKNTLTLASRKLAPRINPGRSRLYVYLAGHGATGLDEQRQAYLVPHDGDPALPAESCLPLNALYSQLGQLGAASVTVFQDTCFSGLANRAEQPVTLVAGARPLAVVARESALPKGMAVLAATDATGLSHAYQAKRHGLYTYFLLEALRDPAARRQPLATLQATLKTKVAREAALLNKEQTPTWRGDESVLQRGLVP